MSPQLQGMFLFSEFLELIASLLLNSISLYGYSTVCLSHHLLMVTCLFHILGIINKAAINIHVWSCVAKSFQLT